MNISKQKIVVIGLGYVGLSNAAVLAQHNEVIGVDLSLEKVEKINNRISPIEDFELSEFLKDDNLNLRATSNIFDALNSANFVIISTPTDYNEEKCSFDTSSLEKIIKIVITTQPSASIIVKSTIPIGFIKKIREELNTDRVMFSPEFLREGKALYDNLYPSRIIIGDISPQAEVFTSLMKQAAKKDKIKIIYTGPNEAEAIKLFANTYLAMRVAYFNELDSYALNNGLDSGQIIEGISFDSRIGNFYNNPSFGYGGYCLPKDSKQMLANFEDIPQNLFTAIVESNLTRKNFLIKKILENKSDVIGVYRLAMKKNSDNFRQSAIIDLIYKLNNENVDILIYEPTLDENILPFTKIENNLGAFKERCSLIIANRFEDDLLDVQDKVFTRDIFGSD